MSILRENMPPTLLIESKFLPLINQFKRRPTVHKEPNFSLLAPRDIISPISPIHERKSSPLLIISGSKRDLQTPACTATFD